MEKNLFNPERLKTARIARGKTIKELAEESEISRQMISNYELGKTIPKGENLVKIVNILNFPLSYFSSPAEPMLSGATFFRSQSAATKKKRDMQEVRLGFQKTIYDKLKVYVNFPQLNLPEIYDKEIEDISNEDIKNKAIELRNLWELGQTSPIDNLIKVVEFNGIIITEANMEDDKLDAVSKWIEDRPYIMLTDNNESAVRRRFNVAHELGHILLHGGVESIHDYSSDKLKNIIERQANLFASHLLLPDDAFTESLISTSLDFYKEIKMHWKVSISAMILKTHQLELINDDQKLYLLKKISWNKWRKKEPLDDIIKVEKPELLSKVYKMIIENQVMDSYDLMTLISLPDDELSKSLGIEIIKPTEFKKPVLRLVQ